MRKLKSLLLLGLLLPIQFLMAQTQVSGRVRGENGAPIPGVTVTVRGTNTTVATDESGNFSISAPANSTLVFSFVGYQNIERRVSDGVTDIVLVQGDSNLQEVVVTGYTTIQRRKFSAATSTVPPAEVRRQPFGSFDQALQGQASGVSVVANSGQPGANAVVRIRGNGSISGSNTPLYVMDGIEISAADFSSLNQGDFERVEVLKDAVATAMYGSRGANGVIVITTRRGRAGQIQLNYDAQLGTSDLPKDRLELMNSAQKIEYELQRGNPYGWTPAEADSLSKVNFSWKDALFQRGVTHQHMLSAAGGSQASRFFASLSYMDQEGIVKTTGLKRYTARINVDNTIKNFRFGMSLQGGFSRLQRTAEGETFTNQPLNAIRWANPYERDFDPNTGQYQETGFSPTPTNPNRGRGTLTSGQPNPAMELFLNYNWQNQLKGVASSYLEFHVPAVQGLFARTNWGVDYGQNEYANYGSPLVSTGAARQGSLGRSMNRNFRYTGTTSINYKKEFGQHEFEGGVFTEVVRSDFRSFGFTGYGFTNGFTNEAGITPGSASNANYIPAVTGSGVQSSILSYFTILNYGFGRKYYVTLVGRRDGSSRFGLNRRFANFGSVGVNWNVLEEGFMSGGEVFDDLRFRVSYGTNGNQYSPLGEYPLPTLGRTTYGGANGLIITSPGNLDLTWETNRTTNIGLDFMVLNRRLSGKVDLYNRKTTNLFYSVPNPYEPAGQTVIPSNFGTLSNRGIELELRGDVIRSSRLTWSLGANITYNRNRIIDLPQDSVISGTTILAEGFPVNSLFLVEYAGVNPANGNAQYFKRDKSVTESFSVNDKVILGTSDAPWYGGINTSLAFMGFDLSAQVNFFLDRVMYNNDMNNVTNPDYFYDNMSVHVLREWRTPGQVTDVPRPTSSGGNTYQSQTTRFLEDASFWRLRNVTLGYNLPASLMTRARIRSARIFVQGQNLWTKTSFQSFDPEMTGTSLVGAQYPALIQTTLGLSIGF
jgi:TonB-linked SusC/RagA family outer membrane protein